MIDWMARAKAQLGQAQTRPADVTDESRVVSVSSAPPAADAEKVLVVSSVLSVHPGHVLTEVPVDANPYMTSGQATECHAGGWDDAEIELFSLRTASFVRMGRADAEHLAERLTSRDRDGDDRRYCLECAWLSDTAQCLAAAARRLRGVDWRHQPLQTILHRCEAFDLRKGVI